MMLNFIIQSWDRLGNWKTSTVGASAGVLIVAQWLGYINIPEAAGVVALAEALVLLAAKDS